MLLIEEIKEVEDFYRNQQKSKNEIIFSTKNKGYNNYKLNLNNKYNNNNNNNEKNDFFKTGLNMKNNNKLKSISPVKKKYNFFVSFFKKT